MALFNSFNEFSKFSTDFAKELHTMVDIKDYPEWGFGVVAFMTDKFGGTYAILNYDYKTKELKIDETYGWMKTMKNKNVLKNIVMYQKAMMERNRNLEEIYDRINEEY